MSSENHIYDFEVFKALIELEIRRIERYHKNYSFSIAFLYAPDITSKFKKNKKNFEKFDVAFILQNNMRAVDAISPVEEDFVFLFFPETDKKGTEKIVNRIKKIFKDITIIEGIVSYPEDGKTKKELFEKLVSIMNEKLIPVINLE